MRKAVDLARTHTRAWLAFVAVGALLIAAYLFLPLPRKAIAVLDVVFPLGAFLGIVVGIRLNRPDRLRPWVLFAVGMTFFLAQNGVRSFLIIFRDGPLGQAPLQDLFQSVGYVLIITALISLIYSRNGGASDRASLIDASIIVVGAAMVAWVFVLAPFAHDGSISISTRLFKMLYPLANYVLLAVSVRLAVSRGAHTPAFALLLMAMVASLVGNTLSLSAVEARGFILPDNPINIAFFLAYIFSGAAPLHPTMRNLTDVGAYKSRITRTRIALFLGASTMGVVSYFIETARGRAVDVPVILLGSLSIFVLVLIRLAGLNKEMRRSEERFRSLVQNASDAFAILDADGTFRYVSPASERVVGHGPSEMIGESCLKLVHTDFVPTVMAYLEEVRSTDEHLPEIVLRARHKDGSWQWLEVSCTNLLDDPAVMGIVANFHDVTETREAEEALRASEQSARLLFDASPLPMWVTDLETLEFLAVNDAAVAHYGYSRDEFLTMKITEIRPEADVPRLKEEIENLRASWGSGAVVNSGEWTHRVKDGRLITMEIVSHALVYAGRSASLILAQDVTERKRVESEKDNLERQLHQSQKLEAVGQLAGGVAHDFNNLLAVILNYGKFVKDDLEPGTASHEDVTQVLSAAEKAARLVKQLLAFSRREIVKPEIIDLNEIVEDLHRLLARTTKESIKIVVDLGNDLWRTNADPGQMEQVLLNLAVNADAAMPNGGTLAIRTSNKYLSEEAAAQKAELTPGNYVCISVSDDGVGMSEATAAHMFEPFFTTKGIGEGTGLGLSTVYGIVKQAGGYIYAYSEEGRGTTFNVYLPATDAVADKNVVASFPVPSRKGTGTILIVEDEEGVRAITERILKEAGYDVLVASNPLAAVDMVAKAGRIDLLLTDVIMPGLSGRELAHRLQLLRPGLKTVFMSGYTSEIIARQGVLEDGVTFLQKPFGAEDLLPLVRDVLADEQHPRLERASTVLVVDDDEPMRQVLRLLLEAHGFTVVGTAANAIEAIGMASEYHPDVIILDQSMPGATGAEAAPKLREVSPQSKICAFSGILADLPSWADAFLSKDRIGELPPILDELGV